MSSYVDLNPQDELGWLSATHSCWVDAMIPPRNLSQCFDRFYSGKTSLCNLFVTVKYEYSCERRHIILLSFFIMRYALSSLAVDTKYADCHYPIKCDLCGTMTDDHLCLCGDLTIQVFCILHAYMHNICKLYILCCTIIFLLWKFSTILFSSPPLLCSR